MSSDGPEQDLKRLILIYIYMRSGLLGMVFLSAPKSSLPTGFGPLLATREGPELPPELADLWSY